MGRGHFKLENIQKLYSGVRIDNYTVVCVLIICVAEMLLNTSSIPVISGFRLAVREIGILCDITWRKMVNSLPTFRDNLSVQSTRLNPIVFLDTGTDRISRNFGKELSLRRVISQTSADLTPSIIFLK